METTQIDINNEKILKAIPDTEDVFSKLSKYRGPLLGIALIMISIAHLQSHELIIKQLHLTSFSQLTLQLLNLAGACGIKIFMFVAGFGAYYSLFRNPDDMQFYKRRAKRMFPYYYPLVIACLLMDQPNILIIAGNLSLLGWWTSTPETTRWLQYFWFHQDIYIIYVLTPIFFRILNTCKNVFLNMTNIWIIFLVASLVFTSEVKVLGVQAIPLFVTGMLLCKLNIEKYKVNEVVEPLIYFLGSCSFFALITFYPFCGKFAGYEGYVSRTSEHLLILMLSAALMMLSMRILMFIDKNFGKLKEKTMQVLSLLGKRALEIYLIQSFLIYHILLLNNAKCFEYIYKVIPHANIGHPFLIQITLCIIILCIIIGILYGVLMDFVLDKVSGFYSNIKFKLATVYKK